MSDTLSPEEQAIAAEFEKIPDVIEKPVVSETPAPPIEKVAGIPTPKEERPAVSEVEVKKEVAPEGTIEEKGKVESPIEEDENSLTFKQRWKSLDGMVKSEKTKREEAEKRNAELADRIALLEKAPPKKEEAPAGDEEVDILIDEAREAYESALQDGESSEVKSKLYRTLRNLENQKIKGSPVEITETVDRVLSEREETKATNKAIAEAIKQYPFLDSKSETVNRRAMAAVKAAGDEYVAQGYSVADAIAQAVKDEAPRYADPSIPSRTKEVDEDQLKGMEVVRKKESPIITQQKSKAEPQSLGEAWAELH